MCGISLHLKQWPFIELQLVSKSIDMWIKLAKHCIVPLKICVDVLSKSAIQAVSDSYGIGCSMQRPIYFIRASTRWRAVPRRSHLSYTIVIHIFEFSLDVKEILLKLAVKKGFRANRVHSLCRWFKDTITSKMFGTKTFKIFACLFADFDKDTFCYSTVFISPDRGTISSKNRDCLRGNLTLLTTEQTKAIKFVPIVWFLRLKV